MREPARESADLQTERLATQQQQQQSCQCECGRVRSYHYQLASWTGPKNSSGALQNATDQLDYWSAHQYRPSIQEILVLSTSTRHAPVNISTYNVLLYHTLGKNRRYKENLRI